MLGLSRKFSFEVDRSPEELKAAIALYLSGVRRVDAKTYATWEGSLRPDGFRFEEDHSWRPRGWVRYLTMDGRIDPMGDGSKVSVRLAITKGWKKTMSGIGIAFVVAILFTFFNPDVDAVKVIILKIAASVSALLVALDYFDRLYIFWQRAGKIGQDLPFLLRNYDRKSLLDSAD